MVFKPADAVAGPFDDLSIHPDAEEMLDYEGQPTVLISKDAKYVSEAETLDYVTGYTAGNDLSAQNFQLPKHLEDNFAMAKVSTPSHQLCRPSCQRT